jgi:hypothetical protein
MLIGKSLSRAGSALSCRRLSTESIVRALAGTQLYRLYWTRCSKRSIVSSPSRADAETWRRSGSHTPSVTRVISRTARDPFATRTRNSPTEMVSMTSASTFTIWWSC